MTGAIILPQAVDASYVWIDNGSAGSNEVTNTDKQAVAFNPGYNDTGNEARSQNDRTGYKSVTIGTNSFTSNQSVAVGYQSEARGTTGSIAIGVGAIITDQAGVKYKDDSTFDSYIANPNGADVKNGGDALTRSVVIGAGSFISANPFGLAGNSYYGSGQGVVVGSSSVATSQATAVGNNVYAVGRSSIAIGSDDTSAYTQAISSYDAKNYFAKIYPNIDSSGRTYGYTYSNGVPTPTVGREDFNKYSPTLAQGDGAIAIGSRSLANDAGATALGTLAFALKQGSTAIGTLTRAEGVGALAFGNDSYVLADNAIAVGSKTQVRSVGGTAYGYKAYAGNTNSMAIGRDVYANIAITPDVQVYGTYGLYNLDPAKGAKSILDDKALNDADVSLTTLGNGGTLPSYIDTSKTYLENLENAFVAPESSTAAGGLKYATATYDTDASTHGVTTLLKPKANAENAIVIGSKSIGQGSNDIVIGRGAIATNDNSFAIGSYAMSLDNNSMAIGLASRATKKNSIAVGTAASVMGENSLSVGTGTVNYGSNSTVVGSRSGIGLGTQNSIVLGSSGFIGLGIQNSMAIGSEASIGGYVQDPSNNFFYKINPDTGEKTGERIQLMGQMTADTNLRNAMAIGNKARVYAKSTTATEDGYAAENGVNAMAIGNEAHAWLENSMALGYQSRTDYTPEQLAAEAWRTPDAIAVSTTSKVGVISVGSVGKERRIVNLAAGAYDTDAVNVSQLKQMYDTIQRQMSGNDEESGLHYVSTNFVPAPAGSDRVDYVAKNRIQNAYSRYVSTLKDYRSYVLKQAYGGAELTQTAKDSFNKELTRLEKILTADGTGITTAQLDNLKLNKVGQGTLTRQNGEVTGLTITAIPTGSVTSALDTLDTNAKNDLAVLTTDGNAITGLTSTAIAEGLHNINYTNELAEATGSVAIGYTAHVTGTGTSGIAIGANSEVTARGGVAIGEGTSVTSQNGVAIGRQSKVTAGDTSGAGTAGISYGVLGIVGPGAGTEAPTSGIFSVGNEGFTRRITHVAAGLQPTDAVNVAQLDSLADQKVILYADKGAAAGAAQALGKKDDAAYLGPNFTLTGKTNGVEGDIKTELVGESTAYPAVRFTLNKATAVTDGDTKVVTSDAVYDAMKTAKPTISGSDGVTVSRQEGAGTTGDTWTIGVDAAAVAQNVNINYKASSESSTNTTTATTGFTFTPTGGGTGQANSGSIKISTAANGVVNFALSNTLQGISTVGGKLGQGQISFNSGNNISFGNATLTNFTDSKGNTDATVASTKEVAAAKTEVVAGTGVTVGTDNTAEDGHTKYTISVNGSGLLAGLDDTYAKKDASNLLKDGTGDQANTKVSALTSGDQANWQKALNVYSKGDVDTKITNVNNSITNINDALDNTIALTGDAGTAQNAKSIKNGNVSFAVTGAANSGITTTTTTDGLTIDIAKNGSVASGNTGIVTGGTVYTAVENAKTTLTEDADGPITVTKDTTGGHNNYTIGLNATTLAENVSLRYKANSTGEQTVLLSDGLNFTNTDNLTATVAADGVVKYTLKDALTGVNSITAGTGNDLSFTANGTTAKVTADGIDLGSNKTVKGLRKAAANGEAVEYSQYKTLKDTIEGTDGNGGLLANTIKVVGNTATETAVGKKLTDNPVFTIAGDGTDLSSTTNAAGVTFTLNKVDSITEAAKSSTKVATTQAVYNAVTGAKTTVAVNDPSSSGILKLTKTESTDLTKNAYTLEVDKAKLTESLTTDFAKKDASNIDPASWRTALNVYDKTQVYQKSETYTQAETKAEIDKARTVVEAATGQTMLTVTKDDAVTAYNKYTVGINPDVLSQNVDLAYKANGGTTKDVKLSDGLDFTSTDNLTASVEDNGVVKYTLKNALTGINSIAGNGKTITFANNGIDMGGAQLKNLADGEAEDDAVTVKQLTAVKTTIDNNKTASDNYTISLQGDLGSTTNTKKISENPTFTINSGTAGLTTTTIAGGVQISLNPLDTLATPGTAGASQIVSSKAVYNAISTAKPKVQVIGDYLTVNGTKNTTTLPQSGIIGDIFKLSIDKNQLITDVKDAIENPPDGGEPSTTIRYGANVSDADYNSTAHPNMSKTTIEKGLNFQNGTNTTAKVGDEGKIYYSLNSSITGMTSIAGAGDNAATMTFGDNANTVTFNDTKVTGLADGTSAKDAVTYGQLEKLATSIGVSVDGAPGSNGLTGPAGQDGLDGQNGQPPQSLIDKVTALRSGTAGNMVYTIANAQGVQERLFVEGGKYYRVGDLNTTDYVKAIDGKWYAKDKVDPTTGQLKAGYTAKDDAVDFASVVANGKSYLTSTELANVNISTVNPDGTVTNRTPILNVESGLGIDSNTVLDLQGVKAKQLIADLKNTNSLYRITGDKVNQVATLGDLKALGLAGIDVAANGGLDTDINGVPKSTYHVNLGGPVSIKGGATFDATKVVSQTEFSGKNIVTAVAEGGNSVNILMKSTPEFTGVTLGNPAVMDGSTVTTPSTQVTLTTDSANKVVFTGDNSKDKKVVLSGLKDDLADNTSAVTRGSLEALKDQLGLKGDTGAAGVAGDTGAAGVNGGQGPAGKDGLDGSSILDKVEAQREGLSGNMVYTDPNGGRVVKVGTAYYNKDAFNTYINGKNLKQDPTSGNWYLADQFDASTGKLKAGATGGQTVAQLAEALKTANPSALVENVKISAVNTDGSTTSPIMISNVKSTFTLKADNDKADVTTAKNVLNGNKEAADGSVDKTGLLNLTGPSLANAATVGELQAVAQAGLDFTGDTVDTSGNKLAAHAPLGSTVAIVGGGYNSTTKDSYDTENVATFVDATNKTITVKMKKTPTFEGLTLSKGTSPNDSTVKLTPTGTGEGTKLTVSNGSDKPIVLTGLKGDDNDGSSAVTVDQLKAATAGLNGIGANGIDGATGPAGKDGLNGQDLGSQILGLRSGNAGTMVYTIDKSARDKTQTRLLTHDGKYYRASDVTNYKLVDGKWYPADKVTENNQVEEGTRSVSLATVVTGLEALNADDLKNVNISAVGADGSITETTVLKNIASGWTTRDTVGVGTSSGTPTGLYALSGTDLTQAATLGDLQKVAKAGLTFSGNSKDADGKYITTTRALNETLAIKGGIELGNGVTESDLSGQNLYTKVDAASGEISIQMRTEPKFTSVILGANGDVKLTATGDKATFSTTTDPEGNVVLNGLKDDVNDKTSAVTRGAFNKLADALGIKGDTGATGATGAQGIAGVNGTNGVEGPAGKDGMNGYSIPAKVEAQREGLTGNMVYTAKEDGARLAKVDDAYYKQADLNALIADKKQANDGKWYDAAKVKADGTLVDGTLSTDGKTVSELVQAAVAAETLDAVEKADVQISTVSPQDGTTTTATTIANVESNLASATPDSVKLAGTAAEKAAEEARVADVAKLAMVGTNPTKANPTLAEAGLLKATGDVLNNAATVGDLQTVAQAGMFFKTNDANGSITDPVHVPLGNQLSIIGKDGAKYSSATYSADNLVTTVKDGKIQVAMSTSPTFTSMTLGEAFATFVRTPGANGVKGDADDVGTLKLTFQKNSEGGTGVNTVVVQGITTGTDPTSAVTKGYVDNILTGGLTISSPIQSTTRMPSDMDGFNQASMASQLLAVRNGVSGPVVYTAENGERVMRVTLLEQEGNTYKVPDSATVVKTSALEGYKLATTQNGQTLGWYNGTEPGIWLKVKVKGLDGAENEVPTNNLGYTYQLNGTDHSVYVQNTADLINYLNMDPESVTGTTPEEIAAKKAFVANLKNAVLTNTSDMVAGKIVKGKVVLSLVDTLGNTVAEGGDPKTVPMVLRNMASDVDFNGETITASGDTADTAEAIAYKDGVNAKKFAEALTGMAYNDSHIDSSATVSDIRYLAKAGLEFTTNDEVKEATATTEAKGIIHKNVGERLAIIGDEAFKPANTTDTYSADNLITTITDAGALQIQMKETPTFKGLTLADDENAKVTLKPTVGTDKDDKPVNVLTLGNGVKGQDDKESPVEIRGVKGSEALDGAVTYGQLKDYGLVGLTNGKDGASGPAGKNGENGKDGLNGKSITEQVVAQRSGLSGNVVYTAKDGANQNERLVVYNGDYVQVSKITGVGTDYKRAIDTGLWYSKEDLDSNGNAKTGTKGMSADELVKHIAATNAGALNPARITNDKIAISAVNPDNTKDVNGPIEFNNLKSGLGITAVNNAMNETDAKKFVGDGQTGLLKLTDSNLLKAANLADLQAVAQAGLDFTGNSKTDNKVDTLHAPLSSTVKIEGGTAYTENDFNGANLSTKVDAANNKILITMKKSPTFESLILNNADGQVTVAPKATKDADGKDAIGLNLSTDGSDGVVLGGLKDGQAGDTAVTKGTFDNLKTTVDKLNSALNGGDGSNGAGGSDGSGTTGSTGAAGKDGLDGKGLIDQVQGLRDGLVGTMVYTDKDGNRLIREGGEFYKAGDLVKYGDNYYSAKEIADKGLTYKDGKFYKDDVEAAGSDKPTVQQLTKNSAQHVDAKDVQISSVNPEEGSTTEPTVIGNVKSYVGYNNGDVIPTDASELNTHAKESMTTLLGTTGANLNRLATAGDLRELAQAGMDFTANAGNLGTDKNGATVHRNLGEALQIIGATGDDWTKFDTKNIMTYAEDGVIKVGMAKAPTFTALTIKGENGKDGADGSSVTISAPTTDDNGNQTIVIKGNNGKDGADGKDGKVIINGITTGDKDDSAATKGYVDKVIDGLNGTNGTNGLDGSKGTNGADGKSTAVDGKTGPAGKDGLNGQSLGAQVLAGRDGLSGSMVYTTDAGERLVRDGSNFYKASDMEGKVKAKDGNFYKKDDVDASGNPKKGVSALTGDAVPKAVDMNKVLISAIDPEKGEATKPTAIGNVKSTIGLDGNTGAAGEKAAITPETAQKAVAGDAKDGNGGLLAAKGATLNRVATVGDLQAVAQAGLDFTANAGANDKATVHRALGTELSITGRDTNKDWAKFDQGGNLMTYADGKTITIGMKKSPVFESIVIGGDPIKGEPGKDGVTLRGQDGKLYIGEIKDGNQVITKGTAGNIGTGGGNYSFNLKKGDKTITIKSGDTINLDSYLTVKEGQTADSKATMDVDTTGLVTKDAFDKSIGDINNKIDNLDLSKLQPNGTIGTGQASDLQAVSGETVRDYLDKNYTNNAVLNQRLTKLSKQANAGTASALAAAAIPQVTNMYDDNLMIGAGTGVYGGESAVAIGVSGTNDNRDRTYKLSTTYDSTGKWGLSAGIGFSIGSGKNTPKPSAARALSERVDRLEAENKALRETNQTEIKDLAAKNDQLQKQVQELQAMLKQLVPQVQAANAAAKTTDEEAEQPVAPAV